MTQYDVLMTDWANERYIGIHDHSRDDYVHLRYIGYITSLKRCGINKHLSFQDWLGKEVN